MKKKSTVILAIILLLLIAAALIAWKVYSPSTADGKKTIVVNVAHLDGNVKTFEITTNDEYARDALESAGIISGEKSTYGLWITTVDGETADESLQQWWGYDINGETAMYGIDSQPISDGDIIDFKLYEGY